jgi:hypothetical protein
MWALLAFGPRLVFADCLIGDQAFGLFAEVAGHRLLAASDRYSLAELHFGIFAPTIDDEIQIIADVLGIDRRPCVDGFPRQINVNRLIRHSRSMRRPTRKSSAPAFKRAG